MKAAWWRHRILEKQKLFRDRVDPWARLKSGAVNWIPITSAGRAEIFALLWGLSNAGKGF
jgi:hypothetical protein